MYRSHPIIFSLQKCTYIVPDVMRVTEFKRSLKHSIDLSNTLSLLLYTVLDFDGPSSIRAFAADAPNGLPGQFIDLPVTGIQFISKMLRRSMLFLITCSAGFHASSCHKCKKRIGFVVKSGLAGQIFARIACFTCITSGLLSAIRRGVKSFLSTYPRTDRIDLYPRFTAAITQIIRRTNWSHSLCINVCGNIGYHGTTLLRTHLCSKFLSGKIRFPSFAKCLIRKCA